MSNKGTNQKVRALSDREQARQKLPVFFGSRDTSGRHSVLESLANACDELNNNFDKGVIIVRLSDDNRTISIEDNGRGIPLEAVDENGAPYYDLLFTTLFAGSKYDNDTDSFSTGCNGLGNAVICLTSLYFECVSKRNGTTYRVRYEDGGKLINGLEVLGNTKEHGSKFTFKLDETVHNDYNFNQHDIKDMIDKKAGVCNKLNFEFIYKGETNKYHYDSLEEYYNSHFNSSIYFGEKEKEYLSNNDKERTILELVVGIGGDPVQEAYLNDTFLKEGGSLNEGIIEGSKQFINKYCRDNALYNKSEKNISNSDIEDSMSFVVKALSTSPEFCNQTKFSTKKELYKELAKEYIKETLTVISIEQKEKFRELVNKILINKRANEKANATRTAIKKELEKKVNTTAKDRVENFIPCRSKDPKEIEFYITEGQSASGGVGNARNKINQCIYGVRGKVLNVSKCKLDEILKNKEIMDIIKIVGTGVTYNGKNVKGLPVFNIDNLNMNKIIILSDEDSHGRHIASLLCNVFMTLMPEVVRKGYLYRMETPLYKIETKSGKDYFAFDEIEKVNITNKLNESNEKYVTKYFKGLGSMSSQDLNWCMLPENRHLTQITEGDLQKDIEMLDLYFKTDTIQERKEFIIENGYKYIDIKDL